MVNWGAIVRGAVISVLLIATQVTAQDDHHLVDPMKFVPSVDSVPMPVLEFTTSPEIESNFDKYYYFYREDTSFEEALGDLRECDGFARGLSSNYAYTQAPYPYTYTAAGAVGGALGNAMVAVIFGSAEKRRIRRVNMRRCMGYKGYGRFGLEKGLWQAFNFEEGFSSEREETRQSMLAQQAKVASQARPTTQELGL